MPDEFQNAAEYDYYEPQYFKFSETYRAWVKLFISDCYALKQLEGFEGTRARFWLNHPIRWIQLVGIVTGIVIKAAHAEIEIDDGSGRTIDLYIKGDVADTIRVDFEHNDCSLAVSHLVRVKGTLANDFKSDLQVVVDKIERLDDPLLELAAWQERVAYRQQVLDKPWICKIDSSARPTHEVQRSARDRSESQALAAHRKNARARKKEAMHKETAVDLSLLASEHQTQRKLKLVFLQYFQKHKIRDFSLRQLRACAELEAAAACVARHTLHTKQAAAGIICEDDLEQHITSSQKYRTMNACLAELVRDGSVISQSVEKGTFSVVGRWNLGIVMQNAMQQMFADDPQRSDVTVRELWQAVRTSGCGFDSISKQMVQKVLAEMQAEVDETMQK